MSRNGTHRSHGLSDGVLQDAFQVGAHVEGDDDVDDCECGSLRPLSFRVNINGTLTPPKHPRYAHGAQDRPRNDRASIGCLFADMYWCVEATYAGPI